MLNLLLASFLNTASAVPLQLTQQGRLVDSSGTAATGSHDLTFRIYNAAISTRNGRCAVWNSAQELMWTSEV